MVGGLELEPGGSARLTHTAHPDKAKCDQNQFTRTFVFGMLQPFHFHIIDTWNKISPYNRPGFALFVVYSFQSLVNMVHQIVGLGFGVLTKFIDILFGLSKCATLDCKHSRALALGPQ